MFSKTAAWFLAPSVPFWVAAAFTLLFTPLADIPERTL